MGLSIFYQDITEQKQAAEKLKKFADRLQALHEMNQWILTAKSSKELASKVLLDLKGHIDYQLATVSEYSEEENILKSLAANPPVHEKSLMGKAMPVSQFVVIDLL